MFPEISLSYLMLPIIIISVITMIILRKKIMSSDKSNILKVFQYFKTTIIFFIIICVVLFLSLPSTPSLSTFGYPEGIEEVNNYQKTLKLLQSYNKAIVRTTEVVYWFIFFFAFWFLAPFYVFVNSYLQEKK